MSPSSVARAILCYLLTNTNLDCFRSIIASLPVNCPDCGKQLERGNLNQHSQSCPRRQIRCAAPGCGKSFSRAEEDAFLTHLALDHRDAVLANHERLFDTSRNTNATPAAAASSTSGATISAPSPATSALSDNDGQVLILIFVNLQLNCVLTLDFNSWWVY